MAVNTSPGYPQNSGGFIPEIWSGKTLQKLYAGTCLAEFCNTDYEGEISSQGDKVIIRQVADIEVRDYTKGQTLQRQTPQAPNVELHIDHALYYNVGIDDIDKFQSDIPMVDKWSEDASRQVKIGQERRVWADIYADADPANAGANAGLESGGINLGSAGSPLLLTKSNILDALVDIGTVLDEQNVPEDERRMVLPWWAVNMIKKSELRDASLAGDGTSILRNGRVGMIDRLTLYGSNLLSSVVDGSDRVWNAVAAHKMATTWAAQITQTETGKSESTFGSYVRGLSVYGYKVLNPEALVHAYIAKGA